MVHVNLPRLLGESSEARIKSGFHPHHLEDVQAPQLEKHRVTYQFSSFSQVLKIDIYLSLVASLAFASHIFS